jgi:hypothetical protein
MGLQHPKCGFYQRCFDKIFLKNIFLLTIFFKKKQFFLFLPKSYT